MLALPRMEIYFLYFIHRTSFLQTCITFLPKRESMHVIMSRWVHLSLTELELNWKCDANMIWSTITTLLNDTLWVPALLCAQILYIWPLFMFVYIMQLLEAQADYHRRSLAALEAAIPTIQRQQGKQQNIKIVIYYLYKNIIVCLSP